MDINIGLNLPTDGFWSQSLDIIIWIFNHILIVPFVFGIVGAIWVLAVDSKTVKKYSNKTLYFIKNNLIVIIVFLVAIFSIYWFFVRPGMIRKECLNNALNAARESDKDYDLKSLNLIFRACQVKHGMKPEDLISDLR